MVRGRDGRLLLSSMGSGTMRERGGRFETLALPAALPLSVVISIADTPAGDVWLGTRDAGLISLRGKELVAHRAGLARPQDQQPAAGRAAGSVDRHRQGRGALDGDRRSRLPACRPRSPACRRCRWSEIAGRTSGSGTASGGLLRVNAARRVGARCARRPAARRRLPRSSKIATAISGSAAPRGIERVRDSAFTTYSTRRGCRRTARGRFTSTADGRTWFAPSGGGTLLAAGRTGQADERRGPLRAMSSTRSPAQRDVWIGRQRGGLTHLREADGAWAATTYTQAARAWRRTASTPCTRVATERCGRAR